MSIARWLHARLLEDVQAEAARWRWILRRDAADVMEFASRSRGIERAVMRRRAWTLWGLR